MYVNTSNITGITDWTGVLTTTNSYTGGWLGITIMIMAFMILYASSKHFPSKPAFAQASFITTILSFFLLILGLVPISAVVISILITCIVGISLLWG